MDEATFQPKQQFGEIQPFEMLHQPGVHEQISQNRGGFPLQCEKSRYEPDAVLVTFGDEDLRS